MRIAITTYPFNKEFIDWHFGDETVQTNELKRKYTRDELINTVVPFDPEIIIAGTEKYDKELLNMLPNLKMISRVGVGYDGIDFDECKRRGIAVTYTPDAPTIAVAELTFGFIFNAVRRISKNFLTINNWNRYVGRQINTLQIGVIGFGRIGQRVGSAFKPFCIINDVKHLNYTGFESKSKDYIYKYSDIITIHTPLTNLTENMVTKRELDMMKPNAVLINTARGGIVNEKDVYEHLKKNPDFTYCCDVYCKEPYDGELLECENAILTPHIGSCTEQSRYDMENGAAKNANSFIVGDDIPDRLV